MSEEKKEQQDFLSGHEELLNSINKKSDEIPVVEHEAPASAAEETPAAPAEESAETSEAKPAAEAAEPAAEPVAEKPEPAEQAAEEEPEPIVEEVVEEPAPIEEVEPAPAEEIVEETAPEPVAEEPEPVVSEPAAEVKAEPIVEEEEEVVDQKVVAEVPPVVTETAAKPAPKKKKPTNHDEAVKQRHDAMEQAEVKEVLNFIMKYVRPVAVALIVICALIIGKSVINNGRMKKEAAADQALMEARTGADYQAILDNYGKTASAPMALMGLAQQKFNAGASAEAAELYKEFSTKYPKHEMAAQAKFNEISCMEAQQQYDAAAAAYGAFRENNENSHLAPVALLGKGRCLEAQNKWAEARLVYEDIIAFYEGSGWAQIAEGNITVVDSKLK